MNNKIRQQFPILSKRIDGKTLVYLDNAATTQKPQQVIDAVTELYSEFNANVHRASHSLGAKVTNAYEQARKKVQQFINADLSEEIIWTSGTTAAINQIAHGLAPQIHSGDEIIVTAAEHHANLVPWQQLASLKKAKLIVLPILANGALDQTAWQTLISERCKVLAFNYASNVTGIVNDAKVLISRAKMVNAITVIDAAQAVAHINVDVKDLDCDFLCFSGHKMFAPTGIGVLYGKRHQLEQLMPVNFGGEMVESVRYESSRFAALPHKLEAGTPNYEGAIGLAAAIDFIQSQDLSVIANHEKELTSWVTNQLNEIDDLVLIGDSHNKLPIITFTLLNKHPNDVAMALNNVGIAVRAGYHCAMPLINQFDKTGWGALRASFACYNTHEEVAYFVKTLRAVLAENFDDKNHAVIAEQTGVMSVSHIEDKFLKNKSWDYQYRELLTLGKSTMRMSPQDMVDENLVKGCESKVWLVCSKANETLQVRAYSDAKIVRGLICIVLAYVKHLTINDIKTFDFEAKFNELGLMRHLSQSRNNGLLSLINKIKEAAR